jgi:hypothetical protein
MTIFITFAGYGQPGRTAKIIPDDYPVSNNMFVGNYEERNSGEITSFDKAWFTNDTLKQTLVFELYTDYFRCEIFHFYNNDIPDDLIKIMELNVANGTGDTATELQKKKYFKEFLSSSKKINKSYFITNKGLKLGDHKNKAVLIYGKPDKSFISKGIEKYEWNFEGDEPEIANKTTTTKPLAEGFGYRVRMFFKNDKLIAMILNNYIP